MIEIDGSTQEGGGQILRTALCLSAITRKPCHIFNIRKGRQKPGLMPQHLSGLRALAQLCQAELVGDSLDSQEIWFSPGEIKTKKVSIKIETAGSITLVLQTLIAPSLFSPDSVEISFDGGATDTFFSPTLDHFRFVFLKILEKMLSPLSKLPGEKSVEIDVIKRGFYPEGGARIIVKILPSKIKPIFLEERGALKKVFLVSGASENLRKNKVAERQISGTKQILGQLKLPLEEKVEYYSTIGTGSQINVIGELENTVFGADNLGKLGKSAEEVGKETALAFLGQAKSNACLDKYAADQILPFLALAEGKSEVSVSEITLHCKTNIWVIEKFLAGKFKIKDNLISWNPE